VPDIAIRWSKVVTQCTIFDKCRLVMAYSNDVVIVGWRLQDAKEILHHWSNKQIRTDMHKWKKDKTYDSNKSLTMKMNT
jgi:hypothetical protein